MAGMERRVSEAKILKNFKDLQMSYRDSSLSYSSEGQDECGAFEVGNLHSHLGVSLQIAAYHGHDPMDLHIYEILP